MSLIAISGKNNSGKDTVGEIIQYLTTDIKHSYRYKDYVDFNVSNLTPKDRRLGTTWEIKKFADKLKDIVCLLLNCTREQLEDREFKEKELGEEWWYYIIKLNNSASLVPYTETKGELKEDTLVKLTPRKLLQLLGTECGRNIIHPNIWVNALMREYIATNVQSYQDRRGEEQIVDMDIPNWIITDMRFPNELKAVKNRGGITIRVNRDNFFYDKGEKCLLINNHPSETALDDTEFDYTIDNNSDIQSLIRKVKIILKKENIL